MDLYTARATSTCCAIPKDSVADMKTKLNKPMKKIFENKSFEFFEI